MSVVTAIVVALILLFCFTAFTGAPFVPSKKRDLKRVFTNGYRLSAKDTLLDLGAGSGTVMDVASRLGAKAIGIELNPILALIIRLRFLGRPQNTVKCCNFYNYNFPKDITVVYTFSDSRDIKKIYNKITREAKRLHKTITFISYAFAVPEVKETKKSGAFFIYKVA